MKTENLISHALCHLDNWLHEPARMTEVSNEQLELLGSISILTAHVEQLQSAREDLEGVAASDEVPNVPVAACCAAFMMEAMDETLDIFTDDSDHSAVLKLREARDLMDSYIAKALT